MSEKKPKEEVLESYHKTTKKQKKELAKMAKKGARQMNLDDVLSEEQMQLWVDATAQRKVWLIEFLKSGDPNKAAEVAYPSTSRGSRYVLSHRCRKYFDISVADIFRAQCIGELEVVTKTRNLLDAKKKIRRFKSGDLVEEVTEEDTFAVKSGLDIAIKMLGIEPPKKSLHGEDPDNPFTNLADAAKEAKPIAVSSTVIEVNPE